MRDDSWRTLNDEALERLLIERWLLRGASLAVILVAAIGATYLGLRGRGPAIRRLGLRPGRRPDRASAPTKGGGRASLDQRHHVPLTREEAG